MEIAQQHSFPHFVDVPSSPDAVHPYPELIQAPPEEQAALFQEQEHCPIDENYELAINDGLTLHMTQAPTAFHGITSDETGGVIWGAAVCLARFLKREMIQGKNTMELGCGGGTPSLVACKYGAKHVVATDFGVATLQRMDQHAKLNHCHDLEVQFLDWEHLPDAHDYVADVVLASDVIYGNINVTAFVNTIDYYLAAEGAAYFATRNGRQGVDDVLKLMPQSGFVEVERIPCLGDGNLLRWRGHHTIYKFQRLV